MIDALFSTSRQISTGARKMWWGNDINLVFFLCYFVVKFRMRLDHNVAVRQISIGVSNKSGVGGKFNEEIIIL